MVGGWCKPIFVSNPQPSCFGLLLGWVAVAWLGFGVMTIVLSCTWHRHLLILPCIAVRVKLEFLVGWGGVVGWWCKVIFMSNPTFVELS